VTIALGQFVDLMQSLVDSSMDAETFHNAYMDLWRLRRDAQKTERQEQFDPSVEDILDSAFIACDCFDLDDPSPSVRTVWGIDERQFVLKIAALLLKIK
jgi:hypothetical protein